MVGKVRYEREEVMLLEKFGETGTLLRVIASIERFITDRKENKDIWKNGSLAQLWLCKVLLDEIVNSYDPNWKLLLEQVDKIYEGTGFTE